MSDEPNTGHTSSNGSKPPGNGAAPSEEEPAKRKRFANFRDDVVGPDGWVPKEPESTFVFGFGPPKPGTWFRVDPRPGRTELLVFFKGKRPDSQELSDTLYYVGSGARDLPEISKKAQPYAVHVVVDSFGRRSLWPRRLPHPSRTDTWASSDSGVAETAKEQWVRRVEDTDVASGAFKAIRQPENEEPLPEPTWEDVGFDELLEKAIPEANVICDASHPLIVYLRTGRIV